MKTCKAALTLVTIVMALTSSLIFLTPLTDSFAQSNTTTADNQSASANNTGYVNQTAVGEESSGAISNRK